MIRHDPQNDKTQHEQIVDAEKSMELGPVAMAKEMGVTYDTYRNWRSERRAMPAVAWRCLALILEFRAGELETEIQELKS